MPNVLLYIDYLSAREGECGWLCSEALHVKNPLNEKFL